MDIRPVSARPAWLRSATAAVACSTTLALAAPSAPAQDNGSSASSLVTQVSSIQGRIDALDIAIGDLRETVNRALVDLHDAQARAEQARRGAEEARARLAASQVDVDTARADLGDLTRFQYRNLGSPSALDGLGSSDAQRDLLDRSLFLRQQTAAKQAKLDEVERARTEAANEESRLRLASEHAERTAQDAVAAEADARQALESAQSELEGQLAVRDAAVADQAQAQAQLADVRQPAEAPVGAPTSADTAGTVTATDKSAPAPEEPVSEETVSAVETTVSAIAPDAPAPSTEQVTRAVQTAMELGATEPYGATQQPDTAVTDQAAAIAAAAALVGSSQAEHASLENPYTGGSSGNGSSSSSSSNAEIIAAFAGGLSSVLTAQQGSTSAEVTEVLPKVPDAKEVSDTIADTLPAAPNSARVETVISRAMSMVGTPYVWGGGDANGPTTGLGGTQKGFDCSGLVLYAFAGVGISLPHYTGYQYQRGTQIDPRQAQRGDLFFWGDNGDSHVAIYLGDGTMIEAPQSGLNVRVTPVRWSGMSPKAVRLL